MGLPQAAGAYVERRSPNRIFGWQTLLLPSLSHLIHSNCTILCRPADINQKSWNCSPHLVSSEVFPFRFLITVASLSFEQEKKKTCFDARNSFDLKFKQNLLRKCMITHPWANQHQVDQTGFDLLPWWVPWLKVTNVMNNAQSFKMYVYMYLNICNISNLKIA